MYKFNRVIYYSLTMIALLIILPITISRLFISIQCSIYDSDIYGMRYYLFFNFYTIILSVFIFFIMNKLHKNNKIISSRTLGIFLLVYPILIGLIVIFAFPCDLSADSKICYDIAKNLVNGIGLKEYVDLDSYLLCYPYQYGYVNLYRIFIFLFKENSILFMRIFQIILSGISNVYLYKISQKLFSHVDDNIYFVISLLWIVPYVYSTYLYGFSVGLSLSIISIYYFIKYLQNNRVIDILISIIFLLLAIYIKQNYTILAISYLLFTLFCMQNKIRVKIRNALICGLTIFMSFNVVSLSSKMIDNYTLKGGVPMITWAIMGAPDSSIFEEYDAFYTSPGMYTQYNWSLANDSNLNLEVMDKKINDDFLKQVNYMKNNPSKVIKWYFYKFVVTWDSFDYLINNYIKGTENDTSILSSLDNGGLNVFEGQLLNISSLLILIGALYFLIKHKYSTNNEYLILLIYFIGGFIYHMIFETKATYIYPYITCLIPISVLGLEKLLMNYDFQNKTNILLISIIIVFTVIINIKPYNKEIYANYSDNKKLISFSDNTSIDQPFLIDNDLIIDKIAILYEGEANNLNNNVIQVQILDDNYKTVFSGNITKDCITDNNWIYIDTSGVQLNVDEYSQPFHFLITNDNYINNFHLIYGYSSWNDTGLKINSDFLPDSVINFKFYHTNYSRWYYYQNDRQDYLNNLYYKLW